ncbi:MAG: bifunctional (p)ppGpp synthetase/guanosine-3',5'-bis(diphosphate) 3'-pyrophosphohydrolase [Clostridia bacterium]
MDIRTRTYEELLSAIENSGKTYDIELINKAYKIADDAHKSQLRHSGEPYVIHPISVACILVEMGMDNQSIISGLLHDVVEDTDMTLKDIQNLFGVEVAKLIDGLTKIGKIEYSTREELQAENIRKMLMAMAEDIRVIIIKFADRMHNLATLEFMSPQKQRDKSLECLEVYAPIAHRLGMRGVKEYMEDVSLKYLDQVAYDEIVDNLNSKGEKRDKFIHDTKKEIFARIDDILTDVKIEGRVKSINGIYRKMFVQGKSFDEIYDLFALRVIVNSITDCYNVLGIIHDMFKPLPNRFKDYISTPKPNMYQSLHTTVIGKGGIPFEVQIRTWDMHQTAELGIAAHWKYKLGIQDASKDDSLEKRLQWIKQMLDNQEDSGDVTELVSSIKTDLVPEEVFVFTPKGDVISLPMGSNVIDFAYAIHSAVGNRMVGAKVDKRIVPLDYRVKTGEIIEVLTTKDEARGPNRDWLTLVRTSEARNKIRTWFKKEKREENITEGKNEFEKECRRNNITISSDLLQFILDSVGKKHSCSSLDDIYASIGYGGIQLWKVLPRIKEEASRINKTKLATPVITNTPIQTKKAVGGVLVDGMEGCLIKFSRCCNPLPGDDIIGFITRGFGVSIHKKSCTNVPNDFLNCPEPERWVKANWAGEVKEEFKSTLHIFTVDRTGILADITMQLSSMRLFIHNLNSRGLKDKTTALISATITINSIEHLNMVIDKLKKVDGVISIERS